MKNGIEIKKNIKVTLSITDVFDKEDYLPNGYEYVCKNGLNIYYGYSDDVYQDIIPFITSYSIWFPYKKEEITDTTTELNDYSARKQFYEDWEEFYNYLKERHEKKKNIETTETTEIIETPLYNINYTEKNNYITNITLTLDPSLFWEEPSTEVSSMIDFTGAYGWKFFYNTVPHTIPCILPEYKEVWFKGNKHIIYEADSKMSEEEFEEFVMDVAEFVEKHLHGRTKTRHSSRHNLVIKQFPINDEEIVTKFTFTVPPHTKFLKYSYKENNWTFFIDDDKNVENFISMISKEAFLSFNDNNEATCVYISKEVPQVSELEKAYHDFLDEVMAE